MTDDDNETPGFTIPASFLTQLSEYTRGYMLLVCNEKGELYAHDAYDSAVIKLGLLNFGEIHITAALKHLHNMALKEEEEDSENEERDVDDERED